MISVQLENITHKLSKAREYKVTCFGSNTHRFLLQPKASKEDVIDFERKHHIKLPEEYRQFLIQLGNGGAGPNCGLLPLHMWATGQEAFRYLEDKPLPPNYLSKVCPLYPELREQPKSIWKQLLEEWEEHIYQGAITISEQGCSGYTLLIVSGPYSGKVVHIDIEGSIPRFDKSSHFLDWYENWLNDIFEKFNYGFPLEATEDMYLSVLQDQTKQHEWVQAIKALSQKAKPTEKNLQAVLSCLTHEDWLVRLESVTALGHWQLSSHANDIRNILFSDVDLIVRDQAFEVLCNLPNIDWLPDAKNLLQTNETDLVINTLWTLYSENLLQDEDLTPFLLPNTPDELKQVATQLLELRKKDQQVEK